MSGPFPLPFVRRVVVVVVVVAVVVVVVHCQYRRMMLFADCIITSKVEGILMRLTKIGRLVLTTCDASSRERRIR